MFTSWFSLTAKVLAYCRWRELKPEMFGLTTKLNKMQKETINKENPAIGKLLLAAIKSYYWSQWETPKRFLYKGFGLTMWKWCGILFPCWNIWLGKIGHLGYDIFHNGVGFSIHFPPVVIINLCVSGKIGWWYKKGIVRIRINKWEWFY